MHSPEANRYRSIQEQLQHFLRQTPLSGPAFVEAAYQELLGRPSDAQGLENAVRLLQTGRSRLSLLQQIVASAEYQARGSVRSLCQNLLGREPKVDEYGWAWQLLEGTIDLSSLARKIEETKDYYFCHTPIPPDQVPYRATSLPGHVWLELTSRCNIVPPCIMCCLVPAANDTPRRDMDPNIWQRLLPVMRQAGRVEFHGVGEPLLYPHLFALLAELNPQRTTIGFPTNGHLLTDENCRRLIEHRVSWLTISLDAASSEMYLRIRRRPDLKQLLAKIRRLMELRAQKGSQRPNVEINMTLMQLNLPEAPRFVELAKELGVDQVAFQQIMPGFDWEVEAPDGYRFNYRQEELGRCVPLHAEMMERTWERAQQLDVPIKYEYAYTDYRTNWPAERKRTSTVWAAPADDSSFPSQARCGRPWTHWMVNVDGEVDFACLPHMPLGNLAQEAVDEIWNGPRARIVRQAVLQETTPRCCRDCFRLACR
jgi:MoaA/NifB/PqqE/SkfB family radical SAM enzyme